jgi:hydrogenase maturation protease
MHKLCDAPGRAEEALTSALEDLAAGGRVYVLGLGNTDRGDDGAGILVAEALAKPFPSYSYSEHDGVEGVVLDISEKDEDATIVFVDAAELHSEPGCVRLVDRGDIRETEITTHRVTVAFMAALLEKSGKRSVVVCIQPGSIEFQGEVTAPVREAVEEVTKALRTVMERHDS